MAKAKAVSAKDNPEFLKNALLSVEHKFITDLKHHADTNTHNGSHGDATEGAWISLLSAYLPARYKVAKAFAIDHKGNATKQLDCLIYDAHFTPKLFGENNNLYVPAEAVYATFEIKQDVTTKHLDDAADKIESLRKLVRTSVPLNGPKGKNPTKKPLPIIGGLLAMKASWKKGLGSEFEQKVKGYTGKRSLDFVLTAKDGFYDNLSSREEIESGEGSLIRGLFRLIKVLRTKNSVPAVDWDKYEKVLK